MTSMRFVWIVTVAVAVSLVPSAHGHGRLIDPPSRSSCWRYGFDGCVDNFNDNELFCGGYGKQWNQNDGKCGVCGDAWDLEQPRPNEAGGTYGQGVIVGTYQKGQVLDITVDLTAAHKGWFEFRLCKNDDISEIITFDCLNENLLELADGSGTRYSVGNEKREYVIPVNLPAGLICTQCVLQWKYNTGNTWDCDPDGTCCTGCGPQEQFYGCSDITIS